jgi:opacity protein-like surface antigen
VFAIVTGTQLDPTKPQPNYGLGTLNAPPWGYPAMTGVVAGLNSHGGLGSIVNGVDTVSARAGIGIWDPDLKTQYAFNWFFGLQYALGNNWTLEANYVGSNGHKLYQEYDVNRVNGDLLDGVFDRLNPYFAGIGYGQSNGASSYNGFNASVRKRYARGLDFQVAYTVGRAVDTASSFGRGLAFPDIYNLNLNRGLADFDVRQKIAASFLYEFPSYKGGSGALGKLLGGWQIAGTTIAQAGQPFSVNCTASRSGGCDWNADGFNNDRPNEASFGNFVAVTKEELLSSDGIFNVGGGQGLTIFPAPAVGTNGNLGRNTFIGPGYFATDLNLQKNTKIPWFWGAEGANIQFRAEMYNAFNQTNLTRPSGNVFSSTFGRSTSAFAPRNIQFGLKLLF